MYFFYFNVLLAVTLTLLNCARFLSNRFDRFSIPFLFIPAFFFYFFFNEFLCYFRNSSLYGVPFLIYIFALTIFQNMESILSSIWYWLSHLLQSHVLFHAWFRVLTISLITSTFIRTFPATNRISLVRRLCRLFWKSVRGSIVFHVWKGSWSLTLCSTRVDSSTPSLSYQGKYKRSYRITYFDSVFKYFELF